MAFPLVYIIVLNWNSAADTAACVMALEDLGYPNFRIVIVDNGSSDDSEQVIKEKFQAHYFIQTGKNLGYGGGNNLGIKYALENKAEYVWIINPDVTTERDCLDTMIRVMEENQKIGICGPRLVWGIEPDAICIDGANIYPEKGYLVELNVIGNPSYNVSQGVVDAGCVIGCSMLFRSKLILDIGIIREDFFMYHEELEFNYRARSKGWRTVICQNASSHHRRKSSQNEALFKYYNVRNTIFVARIRKMHVLQAIKYFLRVEDYGRLLRNGHLRTTFILILHDLKPILAGLLTPLAPGPRL